MTPDEVRKFQRGRYDWEGKPLLVDGDLGDRTRWALAISRLDPRLQAIVGRACSTVGKAETPGIDNRGEWPDFVHRWCGFEPPEDHQEPLPDRAWCAEQASWCLSVEGLPERREAGARALALSLRPTALVLPGFVTWFPTGPWQAHVGIIVGLGVGEYAVVEGNQRNASRLVRRRSTDVEVRSPLPVEELPGMPPGLPLIPVKREGTR
jgi:hypothetical protein